MLPPPACRVSLLPWRVTSPRMQISQAAVGLGLLEPLPPEPPVLLTWATAWD